MPILRVHGTGTRLEREPRAGRSGTVTPLSSSCGDQSLRGVEGIKGNTAEEEVR